MTDWRHQRGAPRGGRAPRGSFLARFVSHLAGRTPPQALAAHFMRITGLALAAGVAIGAAFRVFGWAADAPVAHPGRSLVIIALIALAAAAAWFALGAARTWRRNAGPTKGGDGIVIMVILAVVVAGWSVRGVALMTRGAPVTEALGWVRAAPWGSVTVADGGRTILARGEISTFFVTSLREALAEAPDADVLEIESGGGSSGSGDLIAAIVQREGLDVFVPRYCASACVAVFLAGERRILSPMARLGCHQAASAITGAPAGPSRNFRDRSPPRGAERLHREVVAECDATPPEAIYNPPLQDLVDIGAVSHIGRDPGGAGPAARYCMENQAVCAR